MVVKMMLSTSATTATASTTATTSSASSSLPSTSSSKLIARTSSRSGNDLDEKENTDELSNLDSTASGSNKLAFTNKVSITNTHNNNNNNNTPAGELDDEEEEEANPEHIKQEDEEAENDESSSMAEQADVGDKISLLEIDDVYEYWKKFDLSKFQVDIKSQLQELNQNQPQNSESKAETKRYLAVQKSCTRLLQVLTNMPHPFPYMQRVPVESDNKKSQLEGDAKKERQLIMELSEQVAQTSAENLELKSRLRISEAGVESYKRILADMQQELTEVKHKQLQAELNFVPKSTSIITPSNIDNKLAASSRQHGALVKEENENNENGDEEENLIMDNDDDQQSSTTLMNDEEDDETPDEMSSSITPAINSSIGHQIASSYQQHNIPQQLNTAEIAQKVRDLLSVHNIGQRIFAKSILGLSQGTVSELLSKPKQWDKLTEKGRESYRKMHVWSLNDRAIDALKAISPRKGNTTSSLSLPNSQYSSSFNTTTDNSINNTNTGNNNSQRTPPLASSASNSSNNSQASSVSSSPSQSSSATPVPSTASISHQGLSATTPQQLAATLVSLVQHQQSTNAEQRIAQLLLEAQKEIQAKSTAAVMAAALQRNNDQAMLMFSNPFVNTNNSRSSPFSSNNPHLSNNSSQLRSGSSNNVVCSPPNSSSSTMSSPLGFNNHHLRGSKIKLDTSDYYDDTDENGHHENDDGSSSSPHQQQQHAGHFPLDLTIKTSNTGTNKQVFSPIDQQVKKRKLDDETSMNDNHVDNLLLLKQKTSSSTFKPISSNLIASTTTPPTANVINPKCLLPPISQEQFDKYSSICTEELVRRVKDLLGKHSISQRLFGECILGLSQGSVSDLLARPKPWPMLTQKGREPFIRMQMFIDDPDSIRKLMQNQYNTISSSTPSVTPTPSVATSSSSKNSTSNATPPPVAQFIHHNNPLAAAAAALLLNSIDNSNKKTVQVPTSASVATTAPSLATTPNIIPYDISTLSGHISELNTEEVTNKVKESLLNNNIGQKLFGEAVLNLSQGTVSELLSKPKPWQTLSIKGREPYLRMYMWLSDKSRLDKLNEWKEEKNMMKLTQRQQQQQHQQQQQQNSQSSKLLLGDHNSKLSNSNFNAATSSFMNNSMLNSSDSNSNSAFNNSNGSKPKRRFIFSEEQKEQLMRAFKYDPYPAVNQMEALASKLGLQTRTVINWFHNHRMRIRYKTSTNQVNGDEMPFAPFVPRSRYVSNGSTPGQTGGFKSSMSSSTNNTSSSSMLYLPAQSENDHNHSQNDDEDSRANGSQHHNMNMMSEYDEEDGVDRMNEYDEDEEDLVDENNNNHVRGNNEDMMNGDGNMVNDSIGDEDEDEEEEEEDESGVNQDEINSLYIDNNHDETGSNEDEDENEDEEGGNEYHMMKTHQVFHHQFPGSAYSSASSSNKRRKANNPQKFNHSKLDAASDAANNSTAVGNASSQAIKLEYA